MSKVDVFVPCYNYGHYLAECVNSILSQPIDDVRVLILNDASTDASEEIAMSIARSDRRVSVISHERNWGHIRTYNQGLEWARGDYVILLSADDLLAPGSLGRAVSIMDADPRIALLHGGCVELRDREQPPRLDHQPGSYVLQDGIEFIRQACTSGLNHVETPTAIARTAVHKVVGGYRRELPHSGDMEVWLRLAAHGAVVRLDAIQAFKRLHGANMSSTYYSRLPVEYKERWKAFDSFFQSSAGRLGSSAGVLRSIACRSVAHQAFWTGISQLCRGNRSTATHLLAFAIDLQPTLRYLPPLAQLLRSPGALQRAGSALAIGLKADRLRALLRF